MTENVWYIQAAHSSVAARSYVPEPDPALSEHENRVARSRLKHRAAGGEPISADLLPERYVHSTRGRSTKLNIPIWNSSFVHVRTDLADILRRFDLGVTVLRPIKVTLYGNGGVNEDYLILLTSNLRPTIDPAASEPVPPAHPNRSMLLSDTAVHPTVRAYPAALQGPSIWTDPKVSNTLFVNEDLAMALKPTPFARDLALKKIRLSDPKTGTARPDK